jgi:hypothetical protein
MANIRTHYDNLRVARNAPDSVIKAAYKALCQSYHPDKFQGSKVAEANRIMKLINTSYAVLIDPVKRAEHDAWIQAQETEANQPREKATFGETGEATEQTYQKQETKQETKREYTPPPTEPEPPKAKVVKTASPSMGWQFWVQMIVILVMVKLVGLLGGLVVWGIWSLIAFVVRKYHIAWWVFATVIVISLVALQLYLTNNQQPLTGLKPTVQQLQAGLAELADSTNKKLPIMLDKETRWDKTEASSGLRLNYFYTLPNYSSRDVEPNDIQTILKPEIIKQLCTIKEIKTDFQFGVTHGYVYRGNDGIEISRFEINKNDCNNSASTNPTINETQAVACIGDCINGQGTYTYPDGTKYVGEHKDNKRHGQGTFTGLNSTKYTGEFKDDKANGQGEFTYPDGSKYVGEFKDNNPNGQGTLTYSNRTLKSGLWKDGELVK